MIWSHNKFQDNHLYNNPITMDNIPSNVALNIVGSNCLFVNTGVNAENIPIMNTKINATIMLISIAGENIVGGTPINNTENIAPSTNMKNPLVNTTTARYFAAYSMYGPSITSLLALIIEMDIHSVLSCIR